MIEKDCIKVKNALTKVGDSLQESMVFFEEVEGLRNEFEKNKITNIMPKVLEDSQFLSYYNQIKNLH
jgi:hypothetical protein